MAYHGYDLNHSRFITPPTLVHRQHSNYSRWFLQKDHWELITSIESNDASYILAVRHYWDGKTWYHYEFVAHDSAIGDPVRLVTQEELMDRIQAIKDHEGVEEAAKWVNEQDETRIAAKWEMEIRAALIRRWEAMSELVGPSITL